jgi:putative oxidoreductase
MKFDHLSIPFVGRLLMTYIFGTSGLAKIVAWDGNVAYMTTRHLPFIPELLAIAMVIEVGGSICLITGYQARTAAMIMFLYMAVLTVLFHNYWAATGNMAGALETHFRKNLAIMGGLLMVAAFGPGQWAIKGFRRREENSSVIG